MKLLRHPAAALVVFSIFVILFTTVYSDLQQMTGFIPDEIRTINSTDSYNLTTGTIMDQFKEMNLIQSVNSIDAGVTQLASGNLQDLLGGLAAAGIGFAKLAVSLITAPFAILGIIGTYYGGAILPPGITEGINALISVYIFFILLSAYLRSDI